MRKIQPLKFRTWETGHFKIPNFERPRLQTAVFQMVITVAFGLSHLPIYRVNFTKQIPITGGKLRVKRQISILGCGKRP